MTKCCNLFGAIMMGVLTDETWGMIVDYLDWLLPVDRWMEGE